MTILNNDYEYFQLFNFRISRIQKNKQEQEYWTENLHLIWKFQNCEICGFDTCRNLF